MDHPAPRQPENTTTPSIKKIAIAASVAAVFLQLGSFIFNGDCAVTGLMALHISQLKEFPLYFWGAHYGGTLSSYIAAVLFAVFGVSKTAGALSAILIAWLWIISLYTLASRVLSPAGALAVFLLCLFPPVHILQYSMYFAPSYAEALACSGILFLFAARRLSARPMRPGLYYFLAGAAAGFGLWLSPGVLPASAGVLIFFAAAEKKDFWKTCLPYFSIGVAVGYVPALAYNLEYPYAALYRLGGRLFNLDRSFLGEPHKAAVLAGKVIGKILAGPQNLFKLPVSYMEAAGLLNLALLAASAALAVKEAAGRIKANIFPAPADIAVVHTALFAAFYAFVLSAPAGFRYAVPLYAAAPLLLGRLFELGRAHNRKMAALILAAVICVNISTVVNTLARKPLNDIDELAAHLERTGLKYAFSDYETAYLVTFLTKEAVVVSPTLNHADFFDRYPEYTRQVRSGSEPAFIINAVLAPSQAGSALGRLRELNVGFQKDSVGGFLVLSRLSRKVYPEELGLQVRK